MSTITTKDGIQIYYNAFAKSLRSKFVSAKEAVHG